MAKETDDPVVSFKIDKKYYKQLEELGPLHERDDGKPHTASTYARKLVIEALKQNKPKTK